ncbi:diheme cytochrome c-553 [Larkinella rosea]|uniref:Diheme cytochrome c-553 n=2 Tax=Larkinella rosea TaxID=2025312 RepID=A0A3P1BVY6_9BACT|nr:diheme cytochrome c-553 [Larkinella rosea]
MKKWLFSLSIAIAGFSALSFTASHNDPAKPGSATGNHLVAPKPTADPALIKKGEYLVTIMGCADCHSPKKFTPQGPVPDMDRFLSGHNENEKLPPYDRNTVKDGQWAMFTGQMTAVAGIWGVSFAANLTPDETGIGNWTLEQFTKAFQQGKYRGLDNTRMLLPPMPWPQYANVKNEDVKAIFAYLKSLKPIKNTVPMPIPPGQ